VSANHTTARFVLSAPEGCRETVLVNGHEVALPANTDVIVDLERYVADFLGRDQRLELRRAAGTIRRVHAGGYCARIRGSSIVRLLLHVPNHP
jgi:hypothetical protein